MRGEKPGGSAAPEVVEETGPGAPPAGRGGVTSLLAALGVVYGDIGTSPLYAMQTVFSIDDGVVRPTPGDVFGVVSLVFWSITLIVSVKYVTLVLRADNDGEGGVMALAALVRGLLTGVDKRWASCVMTLGVLGASLFYGDSLITPAISVLSAVEGLQVAAPRVAGAVVPAAAMILTVLFAVQRGGTRRVGKLFGPVMLLWFASLAAAGLHGISRDVTILRALSPTYAVGFVAAHPLIAFVAFGAIVLSITGAEALYADLGHFGRGPIRRAWFLLVFPALTVNYLAQGALILRDPRARANPFFLLFPPWAQLLMVGLATAATVIASQAVISGAFSVSRQAMRLSFLPHLRIRHTSAEDPGQVYAPGVNWALFAGVLVLVLTFRSSTRLANAYGVAVTGTFIITTTLLLVVARRRWRWGPGKLLPTAVVFGGVELLFFTANLSKLTHGGWLTVLVAGVVFTIMLTWQRGSEIVTAQRREREGSLREFLATLHEQRIQRVPGTAVFPHSTKETTPLALQANTQHNHVLHERVVIVSVHTANVPHTPWEKRLTVDDLGDPGGGILHVTAEFGFQDRSDVPEALRHLSGPKAEGEHASIDPDNASYFLSHITLSRTDRPGMSAWREALFIALAHNAASPAEALCLPGHRTVVMGARISI